jgi:hypothetical protein
VVDVAHLAVVVAHVAAAVAAAAGFVMAEVGGAQEWVATRPSSSVAVEWLAAVCIAQAIAAFAHEGLDGPWLCSFVCRNHFD